MNSKKNRKSLPHFYLTLRAPSIVATVAFFLALGTPLVASASETIPFEALWEKIEATHPVLVQRHDESDLASLEMERAESNRTPHLSFYAIEGSTDEPGRSFVSTLNQGAITNADFEPANLNSPRQTSFRVASLTATLPLYSGGAIAAEREAAHAAEVTTRHMNQATLMQLRADAAAKYAALLHHDVIARRLTTFIKNLAATLRHYQLGDQSNLVGHSGKLTLEITRNSAEAMRESNRAARAALQEELSEMAGGLPADWKALSADATQLMNEKLPLSGKQGVSGTIAALQSVALREKASADIKTATTLPQVDFFGAAAWQGGERGADQSGTFGLVLRWDIYSNRSGSMARESALRHNSARARAGDAALQERSRRSTLSHQRAALAVSLTGWEESRLMATQRRTIAADLFRNGAINAIEFGQSYQAELFALKQQSEVIQKYLSIHAALYAIEPATYEE